MKGDFEFFKVVKINRDNYLQVAAVLITFQTILDARANPALSLRTE